MNENCLPMEEEPTVTKAVTGGYQLAASIHFDGTAYR